MCTAQGGSKQQTPAGGGGGADAWRSVESGSSSASQLSSLFRRRPGSLTAGANAAAWRRSQWQRQARGRPSLGGAAPADGSGVGAEPESRCSLLTSMDSIEPEQELAAAGSQRPPDGVLSPNSTLANNSGESLPLGSSDRPADLDFW